jgi:hypothetical protein
MSFLETSIDEENDNAGLVGQFLQSRRRTDAMLGKEALETRNRDIAANSSMRSFCLEQAKSEGAIESLHTHNSRPPARDLNRLAPSPKPTTQSPVLSQG